jgi:secreted trypsin-like serine protease
MSVGGRTRKLFALVALVAAPSAACTNEIADASSAESLDSTSQAITNADNDDADPSVVALLLRDQVLCTGFLIATRVVVTAAHCLDQIEPDTVFFGANPRTKKGTSIAVAETKTHPDYDPSTLENDIGVVVLAETAPSAPLPVLSKHFDASFVGMPIRIVGFGSTGVGNAVAARKHEGTTTIASFTAQDFRFTSGPSQTCEGDSGGPALATIGGREAVIGITSSGDTDCKKFGNDMRMDVFVEWLRGNVKAYKAPVSTEPDKGCSVVRAPGSDASRGGIVIALACVLAACGRRGKRRSDRRAQ